MSPSRRDAIRTLNYWRPRNRSFYFGLRALLHGCPLDSQVIGVVESSLRELGQLDRTPLAQMDEYKSTRNGKVYRSMAMPPLQMALVEGVALRSLNEPKNPNLYSYALTPADDDHYFEFYLDGYTRRNAHVASLLDDNHAVVLVDIEDFYPSVVADMAQGALAALAGRSSDPSLVEAYGGWLLRESPRGIPIGPALGHVIAAEVLASLDRELQRAWGPRYCRYVDDIAVVIPTSEVDRTVALLSSVISGSGFTLAERKTRVVSAAEWRKWMPKDPSASGRALKDTEHEVGRALVVDPNLAEQLRNALAERGRAFPVPRVEFRTTSPNYIQFLVGWVARNIRRLTRGPEPSAQELATSVDSVASVIRREVEQVHGDIGQGSAFERHWRGRRLALLLADLLFVASDSDLEFVADLRVEGVEHLVALATAVRDNNADPVLEYPGITADYCGLMLRSRGVKRVAVAPLTGPAWAATCALQTRLLVDTPDTWTGSDAATYSSCLQGKRHPTEPWHTWSLVLSGNDEDLLDRVNRQRFDAAEDVDRDRYRLALFGSG